MTNSPFIIGISGRSGSGKTYFVEQLRTYFGKENMTVISQDNYYRPLHFQQKDANGKVNFDLPGGIDDTALLADIRSLQEGKAVNYTEYTFNNPDAAPKLIQLQPAPILAVEGIFIYHYTAISSILNYRIFIDCEEHLALQRRIARDGASRGYDEQTVRYQWTEHVEPAYKTFLEPYRTQVDHCFCSGENITELLRLLEAECRK